MATDIYMVITDDRGVVLAGEGLTPVYNPYSRSTVAKPIEIQSLEGMTEQVYTFGGTGTGGGKVVFDPFVITKRVDIVSQATFLAHAAGVIWKYVDLLFVASNGAPTTPAKPYLSYRLGTVGISEIHTTSGDETVEEAVSFVFGQLQIGYQTTKADGTPTAFVPVGWDRVKNIKI